MEDSAGLLIVVGLCAVFWYLFGSSGDGSSGGSAAGGRRRPVAQAQVEQVHSMFPQISQNAIRYNLERGASVDATVERCLRDGFLPEPPAGMFPEASTSGTAAAGARPAGATSSATSGPPVTGGMSLIERYGLRSRVGAEGGEDIKGKGKARADEGETSATSGASWNPSADGREQSLRARKERMVLEARRKMLEKERLRKAGESA